MDNVRTRQKATRDTILRAARRLITTHGVEGFSLRELARQVDFSPASLYEYFDGKDDIIAAVASESNRRFRTFLSQLPADLPPAERVVQLGLAYIEFARNNPEHFMLIFSGLPASRTTLDEQVGQGSSYRLLLDALAAGIERGVFAARPGYGLEQMAYGCWSLVHGMATLQHTHLRHFESDFVESDRLTLETFVAGLRRT